MSLRSQQYSFLIHSILAERLAISDEIKGNRWLSGNLGGAEGRTKRNEGFGNEVTVYYKLFVGFVVSQYYAHQGLLDACFIY